MEYGLPDDDIRLIREVFQSFAKVEQVTLFGSRAIGSYKPGSDIDLAIEGNAITFNDLTDIFNRLEQSGMLYTFDIQNMASIKDINVLEHIKRVGKIFYRK